MDGDANGPVETDVVLGGEEDMLAEAGLECVKGFIARGDGDGDLNLNFILLALVEGRGEGE